MAIAYIVLDCDPIMEVLCMDVGICIYDTDMRNTCTISTMFLLIRMGGWITTFHVLCLLIQGQRDAFYCLLIMT